MAQFFEFCHEVGFLDPSHHRTAINKFSIREFNALIWTTFKKPNVIFSVWFSQQRSDVLVRVNGQDGILITLDVFTQPLFSWSFDMELRNDTKFICAYDGS